MSGLPEFQAFSKIPRLYYETFTITEKIDGTNASIYIEPDPTNVVDNDSSWVYCALRDDQFVRVAAGSRKRWITPESDNFGFASWVRDNAEALVDTLGPGLHYGEWAGPGIQKNPLGLAEKTLFLFNVARWGGATLPLGVQTVPLLHQLVQPHGLMETVSCAIDTVAASNGEGVIVRSDLTGQMWKYYVKNNETSKGAR